MTLGYGWFGVVGFGGVFSGVWVICSVAWGALRVLGILSLGVVGRCLPVLVAFLWGWYSIGFLGAGIWLVWVWWVDYC